MSLAIPKFMLSIEVDKNQLLWYCEKRVALFSRTVNQLFERPGAGLLVYTDQANV